ncbi:hypothetical protein [Bdellovibrio sp. BCCA]|uniref:hypothetical protein n=1 Tax=Bdellovibrio sp. BCCA TaxID=3136281 RepID=UPI0030F1E763
MSSKILCLTLAGMISMQSGAFAQDRTAGIGEEQIKTAKENVQSLKAELLSLDQALVATKTAIEKRDSKGSILSGSAVAGAAVGLGLSVYATFKFRARGGSGDGILGLLAGAASVLMSAGSVGLSVAGQAVKPEADVTKLNEQLTKAEQEVKEALSQTTDKSSAALLKNLEVSLQGARKTLNEYSENESSTSKNKLIAQIAQAAGAAITVYGVTQKESRATLIGPLVMSAGNIGQIISGLSDSEAELVVKEIENTRQALRSSAMALE